MPPQEPMPAWLDGKYVEEAEAEPSPRKCGGGEGSGDAGRQAAGGVGCAWSSLPQAATARILATAPAMEAARGACVCRAWREAYGTSFQYRVRLALEGARAPWELAVRCRGGVLRHLELSFVPVPAVAVDELHSSECLRNIETLTLSGCSGLAADDIASILGACGPALSRCDLSGSMCDLRALEALPAGVHALSLRNCRAIGALGGGAVRASLAKCAPALRELLVRGCGLDDATVASLHFAYPWRSVA